jgi:hypothetical protein
MRSSLKLLVCFFLFAGTAFSQERITKVMAGPSDDQFRIVVAYIAASEDQFNMQSLIIDVDPVNNKKEQPTSYYVDLTATVRSLATGAKKQRILVLRWEKSGDIEVKCDGGKWTKQTTGAELDSIVETVKTVVQNAPLDTKKTIEFTLPKAVEEKVIAVLNSLEKSKLLCIRGEN